ncbi:DUF6297 family protein [Streptomyces sp. NPDC021093]|uniref:DUF6297 family protein n=1 Tax=Streptomyces sp. NPDC021093 TaxID=3365112 RepID=UPI0037A21B06
MSRRHHGSTEAEAQEALDFLHRARHSTRAQRRRSAGLILYTVALLGGFWGIPALIIWSRSAPAAGPTAAVSEQTCTTLLFLLPTFLLCVLLFMARGAMWRGPVVLDGATTRLLLPSKVHRRALLLPRLLSSTVLAGGLGCAAGAVAGFLLQDLSALPWTVVTAAGAASGLSAAVVSTALGALVERHAEAMARRAGQFFALGWALAALAAAGTVIAWRGHETYGLEQMLLWSGPWGWAGQPLLWALGTMGPPAAAGTALALCTPVLGLLLAVRELPDIPQSALRLRATVAARVGASVAMLDFRQARSGVPVLKEQRTTPLLRLPVPRQHNLLVPWRDLTCLLRQPRRISWALAWTALAFLAAAAAPSLAASPRQFATAMSLLALYLGAAQLTEPARLESDDIQRSTGLPWSFRRLALLHSVVPLVLLLTATSVGMAVCVVSGAPARAAAPLLAAVPALVAAALVSSYRGVMPMHLAIGVDTPMGNTGPYQAAAWYVRGPLLVICLLLPVCLASARGALYGVTQLLWQLAVAGAAMWWARHTAHRLRTR